MATIQDIFDWLNQGAQGDIPGTGGAGADSPSGSTVPGTRDNPQVQQGEEGAVVGSRPVPGSADRNSFWNWNEIAPYNPPGQADDRTQEIAERQGQKGYQAGQKAGQGLWAMLFGKQPQKTPQDYTSDIPPTSLMHYQALVSQGIPPDVARYILTQPSQGEGEKPIGPNPWASYSGWEQESQAAHGPQSDAALSQHMWDKRFYEGMNQPTQEGQVQGPGDNFGYLQLPTGQYVPTSPSAQPSDLLSWYQSQGNPQSFWWNPAQGSGWDSLLGGQ